MRTVTSIKSAKKRERLVVTTAYDALFASLFDEKVDMILVGDSLNMSFAGAQDTLSASLEVMIYHTKAVLNGAKNTFIITDMPFGTYTNEKEALNNAIRVYKETDTHSLKLEGGREKSDIIKALTKNSFAVMGHIGIMPQFVRAEGGYKVKGRSKNDIIRLIDDAKAIEDAGAFSLVVEGVTSDTAREITKAVNIPTIGIGAGLDVDGQVLVWSDMLGFFNKFQPKFVKKYMDGASIVQEAIQKYANEVRNGEFPSSEFAY